MQVRRSERAPKSPHRQPCSPGCPPLPAPSQETNPPVGESARLALCLCYLESTASHDRPLLLEYRRRKDERQNPSTAPHDSSPRDPPGEWFGQAVRSHRNREIQTSPLGLAPRQISYLHDNITKSQLASRWSPWTEVRAKTAGENVETRSASADCARQASPAPGGDPRWRPVVLAAAAGSFLTHADRWIVPALLPAMAAGYGVTAPTMGWVISAYLLAYGALQLSCGPLAERFGEGTVILGGLGLMSVSMLGSAAAPSVETLLATRVATALGAAGIGPLGVALVARFVPASQRATALSRYMSVSLLGMLFAVALGGAVAALIGWRWVMLVFGILCAVALLAMALVLRSMQATGRKRRTLGSIGCYALLLRTAGAVPLFAMIGAEGFLVNGVFSFLADYLKVSLGASDIGSVLILSLFAVTAVIGGPMTTRLWSTYPLSKSAAMAAATTTAACLAPVIAPSLASAAVASSLLGLAFIFGQNAFLSAACRVSDRLRSTSVSMVALCFMAGGAAGVQTASLLLSNWSYRGLFGTWSAISMLTVLLCMKLLRGTRSETDKATAEQ